ncbi:hypothetical protein ES703_112680 [subsurface metagenome]
MDNIFIGHISLYHIIPTIVRCGVRGDPINEGGGDGIFRADCGDPGIVGKGDDNRLAPADDIALGSRRRNRTADGGRRRFRWCMRTSASSGSVVYISIIGKYLVIIIGAAGKSSIGKSFKASNIPNRACIYCIVLNIFRSLSGGIGY